MNEFEVSQSADESVDDSVFDVMRELESAGTPGLVNKIISTYLDTSNPYVDILADIEAFEDKEILHASHTLKSSSANVGAFVLSKICAEIERQVRDGRENNFQILANNATKEFQQVYIALKNLSG